MLVKGANGSQLWDTAFAAQALVETGLADEKEYQESATKILEWLDHAQIQENPKHHHTAYRQATKGAWYGLFFSSCPSLLSSACIILRPFSTKEHGYAITDCTSEGLKAVLYLQNHRQ
jgi:lanosterol synthase